MLFTKNFERIEQLAAKEIELDGRGGAKAAELAQAERAAGESYLTGDGAVGVDAVLRLRAEAEAIGRAIGTVRNIRAEVIAAKFRSQAQDARTTATKKTAELDALTKKTARLIDQLAEAEGVDGGQFVPIAGRLKSERLASEIGELERRAGDLDAATVPDSGVFDSESSDAVLLNENCPRRLDAGRPSNSDCYLHTHERQ